MLSYQSKIRFFILTISLTFVASCATRQEFEMLERTVWDMKADMREVEDKAEDIEKGFPQGGKDFTKTLNSIKKDQESLKQGQGEVYSRLQAFSQELQEVTNRIDTMEHTLAQKGLQEGIVGREQLLHEIARLDKRINDLTAQTQTQPGSETMASAIPREGIPKTQAPVEPPSEKEPEQASPKQENAETLYKDGRKAYEEGDTKQAREIFNQVIRKYPKSRYSENAQYWIGETYYKEKDYELAFMAFQEVLRKNPQSSKAPAALYKQALSFYNIGDRKAGEYYLKRLIENYPNSEEAGRAKKKLGQ
jgi:tol-pal system protein YbgF